MKQEIQSCLAQAKRHLQWSLTRIEHCKRYPEGAEFDGNLYKDSDDQVWRNGYYRDRQPHRQWVRLQREPGFGPWEETEEFVSEHSFRNLNGSTILVNDDFQLTRIEEDDDRGWIVPSPQSRRMSSMTYATKGLELHQKEVAFYTHLSTIPEESILAWCAEEGSQPNRYPASDWYRFVSRFALNFLTVRDEILHDSILCLIHTQIDKAAGIERTWCY